MLAVSDQLSAVNRYRLKLTAERLSPIGMLQVHMVQDRIADLLDLTEGVASLSPAYR